MVLGLASGHAFHLRGPRVVELAYAGTFRMAFDHLLAGFGFVLIEQFCLVDSEKARRGWILAAADVRALGEDDARGTRKVSRRPALRPLRPSAHGGTHG